MERTIGMLLGPQYEDLEFWSVRMRLQEEGYRVLAIGDRAGDEYPSKSGGLRAKADIGAAEARADDLYALAVPGGFAPDKMRRNPDMLHLVREMDDQGKVLGFICHAGWVAASAGLMKGRRCTGSMGIKDDMVNAGGIWIDEAALRDGNRVWGRIVEDIPAYQRLLIETLREYGEKSRL